MKRRTAKQGRELARKFAASSLSQAEFARRRRMSVASLRYWLRKAQPGTGAAAEPVRFVELAPAGGDSRGEPVVILRLSGLPSAEYLVELLAGIGRA